MVHTSEDILERVRPIFRDVFDDEGLNVSPATASADIDGWDSLSHINIVIAIEKEFDLKFSLEEVQTLTNVGAIVTKIESLLHEKNKTR